MLESRPRCEPLRKFVRKRLMDAGRIEAGQKQLDRMLLTLHRAGYVTLEPEPPRGSRGEKGEGAMREQGERETSVPRWYSAPRTTPQLTLGGA